MRKRHSDEAFLNITGRDVVEAEYALTVTDGMWTLAGRTLAESATEAETRRERQQLGDRALEVLGFVNGRSETRAADLAALAIGKEQARVYLNRLAESGRIVKTGRGVFQTSKGGKWGGVMSVTSVTSQGRNVTDITDITPLVSGPGRCEECGFHTAKQGHRDGCSKDMRYER